MQDVRDQEARLKNITQKILNQALDLGATDAEVSLSYGLGQSAEVRLGELETIEHYLDQSCGVTVYINQKRGSASSSDLSDSGIKQMVQAALNIAKYTQEDPCSGLPDLEYIFNKNNLKNLKNLDLDLYHLPDSSSDCESNFGTTEGLIKRALDCEALGLKSNPKITNSDGASSSYYLGLSILGHTRGFLESVASSRYSFDCTLIAEAEGKMQREGSYSSARDFKDLWSIERVAQEASEQVLSRLGARKIPTQNLPIVFRYDAARSLIGHYLSAISGGALYRQQSFLLDSLGEQLFPEFITITDDPFIPKALGSAPFDSEGCTVSSKILIDHGKIQTYLLSSYAARRLKLKPTGHAGGAHNIFVSDQKNKDLDLKNLLKQMGTGLLITDLIGQGVNLITGDYSRGASGFFVEQGEIKFPVEEITIASDLKTMFKNIVAVGNDADDRSSLHCGSVLIPDMKIAGGG